MSDISDTATAEIIYGVCMHTGNIDFYILDTSGIFSRRH